MRRPTRYAFEAPRDHLSRAKLLLTGLAGEVRAPVESFLVRVLR